MPVTYGDMKINSFLAIDHLGCMVWSDEAIADQIDLLGESIRSKYFIDGDRLRKSYLMKELKRNWYVFRFPRLREKPKQLDEAYLDGDLLILIEFLFDRLVDQKCLQNLPPERVDQLHLNFTYSPSRLTFAYDFDFISTETYLNYKLFNKLTLNPQLNLLIGGTLDEDCSAAQLVSKQCYVDQFNAPVLSKNEAAEMIINYRPSPFEGLFLLLFLFFNSSSNSNANYRNFKSRKTRTSNQNGRLLYRRIETDAQRRLLLFDKQFHNGSRLRLLVPFLRPLCGDDGQKRVELSD